ncbi:aspartyl/glutamyl-tRNA(Asn/Gln) amidotransferase subunit A [Ekhidna lutea]|uniref:Glutamyl-tRNA(Gln) amidotransferase subunit A n=1 Tax=Ekhidna lutea TaxID=447679 RepID=A0A239IV25_EKHLU|nr:Asp-tRNA(Asn)/Glu-tRNA(Gln) amidotransferase subunit GatA [Ekhidna lutea]SNS97447.1 aspartyl/glutamyl-tRNA(Asn/Gln) amidotransferase subunit A [Ekhidna lutea]
MKNFQSLSEIRSEIADGKLSVSLLVKHYLKQIEDMNGRLNAFLSVYADEALRQSHSIDRKIKNGTAGKLAGMVVGIKDVFAYKDHRLQCASNILQGFQSQYTATSIQRLINEDAIIIGHQNCDEFAMGSSNENSAFGPAKNPINEEHVPGGSSGGSAVAVASDMCQVSIGSDTGGSVRQPAAFCGTIGLKPTYSRISRHGLAAYASSFDTVGILGKTVEDIALVLEVMSGADEYDSTVSQQPVPRFTEALKNNKYKVAYLSETLEHPSLNYEIKDQLNDVLEDLKSDGHQVAEAHISMLDYLLPTYYVLTAAEASSNLSRYDGVRYGVRNEGGNLESMYKKTRSKNLGVEVKRRIMTGTFVLSASYYDAYYTKAQRVRRMIRDETISILEQYDFIISPTTPTTAFKIGEMKEDPMQMYLEDLYTVQANVTGIPAISIPIGFDNQGLPIGVQLMSKSFNEADLLDISKQIITFKDQKR